MSSKKRITQADKDEADKLARKKRADKLLLELRGLDPDLAKLLDEQGKPMRDPAKQPVTWAEHVRFAIDPELQLLFDEQNKSMLEVDGSEHRMTQEDSMPFLFLQMTRNLNRIDMSTRNIR